MFTDGDGRLLTVEVRDPACLGYTFDGRERRASPTLRPFLDRLLEGRTGRQTCGSAAARVRACGR